MNREFLLNLLFLITVNLLIKPFYLFGIDRTVQNTVEPGVYGVYFALFNTTFLFQILNDLGIQYYNNRSIAQFRPSLRRYYPNILVLKGMLGLLYLAVVFLFTWLAGYGKELYPMIGLLAFNMILISFVQYLRSNLSGLGLYRSDSLLSVMDRLLLIGVCGLLLWHPVFRDHFRIMWFVGAQTGTLLLTALTGLFLLHRKIGWPRFEWRPAMLRLILRRSAPYALLVFLMSVYTRIDGIMVERMATNGSLEADLYASAFRLLDAGNMFGILMAGLLFPMFSRLLHEGRSTESLLRLSMRIIWAASVCLAAVCTGYREPIMRGLYANGSAYSGDILGVLMLSFLAMSGGYVFGALLGAAGRMRSMNLVAGAGILANILLNLILIPRFMALGAALATFLTQSLVWFGQMLLARAAPGVGLGGGLAARMLIYVLLAFTSVWLIGPFLPATWWIKSVFGIGLCLFWAFVLNFLRLGEFWALLRESPARA